MTLPTDPTPSGPGPTDIIAVESTSATLSGIRELISVVRDLIDRIEDRVEQLARTAGKQ
jgi:hypothetical protein